MRPGRPNQDEMSKKKLRRATSVRQHAPEAALAHATSLFNRLSLGHLWRASARLSLYDVYTSTEESVDTRSLLHSEKLRLLNQVILLSRASYDSPRWPDSDTLRRVLNDCNHLMNNTETLAELARWNRTNRVHLAAQLFLSQMANVQFPGQEPRPRERVGRLIAMLEILPRRSPDKVAKDQKQAVERLMLGTREFLGAPLSSLAECFFTLMQWQAFASIRVGGLRKRR
jgi:hypothetical protein